MMADRLYPTERELEDGRAFEQLHPIGICMHRWQIATTAPDHDNFAAVCANCGIAKTFPLDLVYRGKGQLSGPEALASMALVGTGQRWEKPA